MVQEQILRVAHLCCGIGGGATGFKEAGYSTVYANDIFPLVANTFEWNLGLKVDVCDVNQIDVTDLPNFDVLTASIPRVAMKTLKDSASINPILNGVCRVIQATKPQVFCLESMYSVGMDQNKPLWCQSMIEEFETLGYTVKTTVVSDRVEGGCPTPRKELLVIGFLDAEQASRFRGISPAGVSVLNDYIHVDAEQHENYYLRRFHSSIRHQEIEQLTPEEMGVFRIKNSCGTLNLTTEQFLKLNLEQDTMQLVSGSSGYPNYVIRDAKGVRIPTIEEWLNIKGFPISFNLFYRPTRGLKTFNGQYKEALIQMGSAMCVPLAKQIALAIRETF